jgi:hypothetical protein
MKTNKNELERVRRHTPPETLAKIEQQLERNVSFHGTRTKTDRAKRIAELEEEWSVERYLDTNASALGLGGALLGLTVNRTWFLLSAGVGAFLLQHAISGWCPPVSLFRRFGVRTRSEIDREKFALKALRGDFKNLELPEPGDPASAAKNVAQAAKT